MNAVNFLNVEYLFLRIYQLLTGDHTTDLPTHIVSWIHTAQILSTLLSLSLLMGIAYAAIRYHQLWHEEAEEREGHAHAISSHTRVNPRWEKVMTEASSGNPNDWRHAIMEADIMLGDLLTSLGYPGEGIGEQLKGLTRGDFPPLDSAWDAHKVRNTIAHQGSDFLLTQREAHRVIDLYRRIFETFDFI